MPFALALSGEASTNPSAAAEVPRAAVAMEAKKPSRETATAVVCLESASLSRPCVSSPPGPSVGAILGTSAAVLLLSMIRDRMLRKVKVKRGESSRKDWCNRLPLPPALFFIFPAETAP